MRLHSQESTPPHLHHQHLVNNSLHPGLQHKRVSFDTTLYCLMHKKILRKAVIERGFHDSFTSFKEHSLSTQKGFRGKLVPNSNIFQKRNSEKSHNQILENKREREK